MPVYDYKALDGHAKSVAGIIDADSRQGARQKLQGRGLFPVPFETWASTADLQERLEDPDAEDRAAALEALVDRGGAVTEREIIKALDLRRPIFRKTAAYGHFGRNEPEFTWEKTNMAEVIREKAGL